MHPKYRDPARTKLTDRTGRFLLSLQTLVAVMLAQGYTESATVLTQRAGLDGPPNWDRLDELERLHRHETAALVAYMREIVPPEHARHIYIGMTSSDLMDTAEALAWSRYWPHLKGMLAALCERLTLADPGNRTGRTHGRATGQPVPVNHLYGRAVRNLRETSARIDEIPLRASLSGPVGMYSDFLTVDQAEWAAQSVRLQLDSHSTQTSDRHRWSELAFQLTQLVGVFEQLATYHRLSSISEVDEFSEGLTDCQMGSSSMPHKVNPISAEQVCGLARLARSNLSALTETWRTQWWERDLTNSSVERVAWDDLLHLVAYLAQTLLDWEFELGWNPALQTPYSTAETPFEQYNRRVLAGENPDAAYREIQNG